MKIEGNICSEMRGSIYSGTKGSTYFGERGSITIGTRGSISSAIPAMVESEKELVTYNQYISRFRSLFAVKLNQFILDWKEKK